MHLNTPLRSVERGKKIMPLIIWYLLTVTCTCYWAFLLTTFIGAIPLFGHTSPTRYVSIIINLLSTQHIYRKKCDIKFAYVQLHTNLAFT